MTTRRQLDPQFDSVDWLNLLFISMTMKLSSWKKKKRLFLTHSFSWDILGQYSYMSLTRTADHAPQNQTNIFPLHQTQGVKKKKNPNKTKNFQEQWPRLYNNWLIFPQLLTTGHVMVDASNWYLSVGDRVVVFIIHHALYPMMHLKKDKHVFYFLYILCNPQIIIDSTISTVYWGSVNTDSFVCECRKRLHHWSRVVSGHQPRSEANASTTSHSLVVCNRHRSKTNPKQHLQDLSLWFVQSALWKIVSKPALVALETLLVAKGHCVLT